MSSHRINIDKAALKTTTLDYKKDGSVARSLDLKLVGSSQFMLQDNDDATTYDEEATPLRRKDNQSQNATVLLEDSEEL